MEALTFPSFNIWKITQTSQVLQIISLNNLQPAASHTRQTLLKEKRKQQSKSDLAVTPVPYLAVYTPKASRVKPAAWNANQSR